MTISQIVVLFFIAALLFVVSAGLWYMVVTSSPKYELKKRLRRLAVNAGDGKLPSELKIEILQEMSPLDRLLLKIYPLKKLDALIDKADLRIAGVKTDVKMFILIMLISAALAFAIGMLVNRGLTVSLVFLPVGAMAPLAYLHVRKNERMARFTWQFPDALDMIARSLRAGHSLTAAVHLVSREMPDPVASLFKTAYEEQTVGLSMSEAITHMTDRVDSTDVRFFVMAVNIHKEMGGNLGEILDTLARTIRERMKIRRQVKVYTAQARLSGYILAVVPLAMAVFFYFASPGYMEELLAAEVGKFAIAFAIAAQIAGFIVIKRIINIRI